MGRKICNRWFSRIVGVIASLSAFCISGKDDYVQPVVEEVVEDILDNDIDGLAGSMANTATVSTNSCHTVKDKLLMFASTLDGRISVLDVHNDGQLLWSVQADARPLLSSSIGKLQLNKDGVRTRLIPSLDGGLYQYDGDSIEAVPITAEKLLGSSFHLDDNTMMIGGKDTKSYGVDALSGQVRYVCGVEGCKFFGEGEVTDDEDIIVIKRSTQTVRAVEARTGAERWNFSVGHHELEFIDASLPITDDDKDGITITPCPVKGDDDTEEVNTYADLDQALKIIVPEGIVVALNPEDDAHILWQHKFSSPVTGAWILKKGVMKNLSLFDNRHIPALSSFQPENMDGLPREPLLYVGMHQNQLYVQPSAGFRDDVVPSPGNNFLPPVAWRPYLSSAASRTPIFKGNQRNDVPLLGDKSVESKDKSLIVWHENYPFDNGYYLYPDVQRLLPVQNLTPESSTIMFIPTSLHYWWKEVIAISVLTSIVLHIVLSRIVRKEIPESSNNLNINSNNSKVSRSNSENSVTHTEFISRFSTEFEFVHCLGKGGFGVVFEAKNRMDECHYAVKRICLSNSIGAKDRVMREVRALAKLDNPGIVRYFNAWMENPPLDWKDSLNTCLEDSECILPTPCNSGTDLSSLKFGGQFGNFALSSNDWGLKCGTSQVFNVHETEDISTDESGSYSIGTCDQQKNYKDNEVSFQIEFADPDLKSEQSSTTNEHTFNDSDSVTIPFQNYNAVPSKDNSLCIVFEDSGCKDKSSNESDINRYSDNVVFDNDYTNDKDSNDNESNKLEKVVVEKQNTEPSGNLYLYIQMQLCRRETLKDWLCANTLNRDRRTILDIFDQIVEAVDYVHGCGLMHRDLKPSNIFFSMDGAIKIGDFGLVTGLEKQSDQFVQEITGDYMKHTAEVGTQLYMSPEQVTRGTYDHKVDIFSMGMILFELFYPFSTQMERITVLVDIKRQIFPPRFVKEMPNENKFAGWLLALNPAERPSTTQILDSELLKDFAARRSSNRFRSRTISGGSSSSTTAI